jgi:putative addiction module component (TIGR02574 family)
LKTESLIKEVTALPVEERAYLAECVLRTLNTPDSEIDIAWATEVRNRLEAIRSGLVQTIPGEQVFERIRQRLAK